ncbi:hypothetical protein L1049_026399 [Liquidambar formosana]|uniref:BOI-related E3 ubiquitin-protein ligase 2 n=1 Tax=Liquidambar formosana TaxID=63359 RepID=A0AAP0NDA8_LIQFO
MAIQAQLYSENLVLPMCVAQDHWAVNPVSGFGDDLYSNLQQQPQAPQQLYGQLPQYQTTQNLGFDCSQGASSSCGDNLLPTIMPFSQSLAAEVEKQRQEIDFFLQLQNERLRSALQEQRKQQQATLLRSLELKTLSLMRQKEEDLAKATRKTMELEDCLKRTEMESESWQRLAKANEAMVIHLNNTLEEFREKLVLVSNGAGDAESLCGPCDSRGRNRGEGEGEGEGEMNEHSKKMACKGCNSRSSCVLFLPCRHLCSCKPCEAFLGSCPVCKSVKEGSMEVFLI